MDCVFKTRWHTLVMNRQSCLIDALIPGTSLSEAIDTVFHSPAKQCQVMSLVAPELILPLWP